MEPKYGYTSDSSLGGEHEPIHTLEKFVYHEILFAMDQGGLGAANQSWYDPAKVEALVETIKEDLGDFVDLQSGAKEDLSRCVQIYMRGYDLEKLKRD
jgi:hypothetical protein